MWYGRARGDTGDAQQPFDAIRWNDHCRLHQWCPHGSMFTVSTAAHTTEHKCADSVDAMSSTSNWDSMRAWHRGSTDVLAAAGAWCRGTDGQPVRVCHRVVFSPVGALVYIALRPHSLPQSTARYCSLLPVFP